jgi:O-antigen/teichoic acid export membrane protein
MNATAQAAGRRHGSRRAGWVVASQALSSISNFGMTLVVAREVDQTAFGWFALAFAAYGLVLSVARAAVGEPLTIRFAAKPIGRDDRIAAAAGAAAVVGVAGALATLMVGGVTAALGGDGAALAVMAVALPGVLVQDLWRFAFFTVGTPHRAATNDLLWVITQIVLVLGCIRLDWSSAPALVAAWGLAGAIAAVYGAVQMGRAPAWRQGPVFLRHHRDLGGTLTFVTAVYLGTNSLVLLVLGPVVGIRGLGALRGANALYGPYNLLVAGLAAAGPAEAARTRARHPERFLPNLWRVSVALALCGVLVGAGLGLLPAEVGRELLGETWPSVSMLLPAVALDAVGRSAAIGGLVGLRVLEAKRDLVRTSVAANGVQTVMALLGGAVLGIQGAAWGLATGSWVAAAVTWHSLGRTDVSSPGEREAMPG